MADDTILNFRAGERPPARNDDQGQSGAPTRERREEVMFDRHELGVILSLYGRMVASGEWRDYAIGSGDERAVFAVFRRATEVPLYRIEKHPRLRNRQGMFCVVAASGMILKRGNELGQVLKVLEPKTTRLVD
jgi:hypothetical protein